MRNHANLLTVLVLGALVLGAAVGHYGIWSPEGANAAAVEGWRTAGKLVFIRPLMLLIMPLVFTSVLTGVTSVGDPKKLGFLGGATLLFYLSTMVLAVGVGVVLATVVAPGKGISQDLVLHAKEAGGAAIAARNLGAQGGGVGAAWLGIAKMLIPDNFMQAAVQGKALSVITGTIGLGIGLVAIGEEKAGPFLNAVQSLHEALMRIVMWVIWLMPVGVLCLVAASIGEHGLGNLVQALAKYVVVVLAGLGVHMLATLPLILWVFTRTNPFVFMWRMRPALLMAFGTASSMATLPVTIETAQDQAGCSKRAAGLVLPLGATVNMDGTALYQGISVIFMFQAYGYELGMPQVLAIVLTATLSAVGAAGVPGGGLATILIIIGAVNATLAGSGQPKLPAEAVGLILAVDRVLDMCRTAVNVWGDSVGARLMTRLAPDHEQPHRAALRCAREQDAG